MIWFLLQKIGFYIFLILTIYFTTKRKVFNLLVLYFWGLTFATCYQFYFTIWFPSKIISLGLVTCICFMGMPWRDSPVKSVILKFVSLFFLTLVMCDILGYISPPEYAKHINRVSRIINTNITYITGILLFYIGFVLPRGFVKRLLPHYCLAIEVAIAFGLVHFICIKLGIDFMPILRQDGSYNTHAAFDAGGVAMWRVYGVSGEPKSLAFIILPYLFVSLVTYSKGIYRRNNPTYHLCALTVGTFVLIQTFSSAALITFAVGVPLMLWFLPLGKLAKKIMPAAILGLFIVGIVSAMDETSETTQTYNRTTENPSMGYGELLYERSFGRATNEMETERQERVVLDHYFDDPDLLTRIIGYGTAQYTFHIPGQTIGNALIPMQSGFVLALCDFGILGVILYIMLGAMILQVIKQSYKYQKVYGLAFGTAALGSFIGSLMFGQIITCSIYLMLALFGYYDSVEPKSIGRIQFK